MLLFSFSRILCFIYHWLQWPHDEPLKRGRQKKIEKNETELKINYNWLWLYNLSITWSKMNKNLRFSSIKIFRQKLGIYIQPASHLASLGGCIRSARNQYHNANCVQHELLCFVFALHKNGTQFHCSRLERTNNVNKLHAKSYYIYTNNQSTRYTTW
jgi:hypothetical protein